MLATGFPTHADDAQTRGLHDRASGAKVFPRPGFADGG